MRFGDQRRCRKRGQTFEMKKLIIFDLDGTLLDTLDDLKNAVNHGLFLEKWPKRNREQIRKAIGNGVAKLVERSLPKDTSQEDYNKALAAFRKYYGEHYDVETKPYPDIKKVVNKLKEDGFLLAVCTNKTQAVAENLVNKFFADLFDYVQGDVDGIPKKPEPDMISNILNHFQLKNSDCLYVGDTEVDRQTAKNSHLDYFIVGYGYRTWDELKIVCPDSDKVKTPQELYLSIKNRG